MMELVPLRARAACTICHSKLPPRTEVYWDEAARAATCQSCMTLAQHELGEPAQEVGDTEVETVVESVVEAEVVEPAVEVEAEVGDAGPDAQPEPDRPEEPEPEADPLPPAAHSPFQAPRAVSHGLTIRPAASSAGSRGESSFEVTELDRGDMGEGRVGQTIEAARIHGLEVLHGFDVAPGVRPIDHLVIAVNGIWVVRAQDALTGRLERRDLGDWFSADPRLFVNDEDASHLVDDTRRQVDAVRARVGPSSFGDTPVRGVICYGIAPAGWASGPFTIANIKVTFRNLLVEPMLDPVLLDDAARTRLTAMLAADRIQAKTA